MEKRDTTSIIKLPNKIIKAPQTANYLGEFLEELPKGVLINKVTTGCGGTTIAIESSENYVICVPYKSMIINKKQQHKNILDVYGVDAGGAANEEIKKYKGSTIMVTWNSLERLIQNINIYEWNILVDEAHKLVDSGNFRAEAINNVLKNYKSFKTFSFMTATPVLIEYQLDELKDIPEVKIEWPGLKDVIIDKEITTNVISKISVVALRTIEDEKLGNLHVFINSVKDIIEISRKVECAMNHKLFNKINIVCANNNTNQDYIHKNLGSSYSIANVGDVKRVNFYTSMAFEGSDIFDEGGRIYIAVQGRKDHTKINILTTLPQIIGRIRNIKNNNYVKLIYSPENKEFDITEREYRQEIMDNIKKAEKFVKEYYKLKDNELRQIMRKGLAGNQFYNIKEDLVTVNTLLWKSKMHDFISIHQVYKAKDRILDSRYKLNDIWYSYKYDKEPQDQTAIERLRLNDSKSFEEIAKEYCELMKNPMTSLTCDKTKRSINAIEKTYPFIAEAWSILGEDGFKKNRYRKGTIKKGMIINKDSSNNIKIKELLNLEEAKFYSNKDLKARLTNVYDILGLNESAKAMNIVKYYSVSQGQKRGVGKGFYVLS